MEHHDISIDKAAERWKDVEGFAGKYQISNQGNLRRVFPSGLKKLLTPFKRSGVGRKACGDKLFIGLTNETGKRKNFTVSQLVARHFLPPPKPGQVPHHKNLLITDNWATNLEYIDRSALGRRTGAISNRQPVVKIDKHSNLIDFYTSAREAGRKNFMSAQTITDRCNGSVKRAFAPDGCEYAWEDSNVSIKHAMERIENDKKRRKTYAVDRSEPKYEIKTERINDHDVTYKIIGGTAYHDNTPAAVINVLENSRKTKERVRVFLGDAITGKCWLEEYDISGHIGRSTGSIKIPLLIYDKNTRSGPALLDHCIVRITTGKGAKDLYKHPKFHLPELTFSPSEDKLKKRGYFYSVFADGVVHANFQVERQANDFIKFMKGEVNIKRYHFREGVMTKDSFEYYFEKAIFEEAKYIGVKVEMLGLPEEEVIINPLSNFELKRAWHREMYDDSMCSVKAPGVKITGIAFGDSYGKIYKELFSIKEEL